MAEGIRTLHVKRRRARPAARAGLGADLNVESALADPVAEQVLLVLDP